MVILKTHVYSIITETNQYSDLLFYCNILILIILDTSLMLVPFASCLFIFYCVQYFVHSTIKNNAFQFWFGKIKKSAVCYYFLQLPKHLGIMTTKCKIWFYTAHKWIIGFFLSLKFLF